MLANQRCHFKHGDVWLAKYRLELVVCNDVAFVDASSQKTLIAWSACILKR